jgi:hypothetical protein
MGNLNVDIWITGTFARASYVVQIMVSLSTPRNPTIRILGLFIIKKFYVLVFYNKGVHNYPDGPVQYDYSAQIGKSAIHIFFWFFHRITSPTECKLIKVPDGCRNPTRKDTILLSKSLGDDNPYK